MDNLTEARPDTTYLIFKWGVAWTAPSTWDRVEHELELARRLYGPNVPLRVEMLVPGTDEWRVVEERNPQERNI